MRLQLALIATAAVLAAYLFAGGEASAQVTGAGSTGCSGCGVPTELEPDARALREAFSKENTEDLLDQQILGSICTNHQCGQLNEEQASRLLDRSLAAAQQASQWWNAFWSWFVAGLGLLIAAGGLWIAALSLRQSNRNEREIGQIQGQLIDTKGEIK